MMLQSKYAGYINSRNGPARPSAGNGRPVLMMVGLIFYYEQKG